MKFVGPMAQDVMQVFPDKVGSVEGWLYIRLNDLPAGISASDLYRPIHSAGYPAAFERWRKVFAHWRKHDS
jgi:hypothetical protein